MGKLQDKYYDGVVVNDDVDPNHAGAVRIRIVGVTDELEDKDQPWAIPSATGFSSVPTKGAVLEVMFDNGDVNKPKYFAASAESSYLPTEYVNGGYPHVAVANLGGDAFNMVHHRRDRDTLVSHPSQSVILWDNFGRVTHDSDRGHINAGQKDPDGNGQKLQPVLTQGTIDIFTCRPVGFGDIPQGSEYFYVTHISQQTVDEIQGKITTKENAPEPLDANLDQPVYKELGTEQVLFVESQSAVKIDDGSREVKQIAIARVSDTNFLNTSKIIREDNDLCAHYLIGKFPPSNATSGDKVNKDTERTTDTESGFVQFVDINDEAIWFPAGVFSEAEPTKSANKNSVIILYAHEDRKKPTDTQITQYQRTTIDKIVNHVRETWPSAEIVRYKDLI